MKRSDNIRAWQQYLGWKRMYPLKPDKDYAKSINKEHSNFRGWKARMKKKFPLISTIALSKISGAGYAEDEEIPLIDIEYE